MVQQGFQGFALNSSIDFNATRDHDHDHPDYFELFFRTGIWECVVAGIGAPANLLVLCIAVSLVTRPSKRHRGPKIYNQYYVLSMSTADFVFCTVHAPLYGMMYVYQLDYSFWTCRFLYVMTHVSTVSSSLSLLCLNIDKFVAVHKPLHHGLIMNKRTTVWLLATAWTISILWAVLLNFVPLISMPVPCQATLNHEIVYYTFAVLFFLLPILLSFLIAVYVALITGRSGGQAGNGQSYVVVNRGAQQDGTNLTEVTYQRHSRFQSMTTMDKYKAHARTLTFVFCSTIWSTLTSIPYRTSLVLRLHHISSTELSMFLFCLMAANALGNPFITLITQRQYRSRLRRCPARIRNYWTSSSP